MPQGAHSTVDYLLDLFYAKNQFLTVIVDAEVLCFEMDKLQREIEHVLFRDKTQQIRKVKANTAVVLSAGTIDSARIALNSRLHHKVDSSFTGKGLMDHEIWGVRIINTFSSNHRRHEQQRG